MSRASRIAAAAVATLAVIGILVVVELISIRYHYTWDLTANRRHSLSEASRRALAGLDRDVTILAFYVEARPGRQQAEDLLVQYRNASPRIRYELIDPQRQVGLARQHQVTTDETMVVLAGNGERRETVTFPDEEKLTNAILKVTRAGPRTVYVTTGHGERQLDETAERGLSRLKAALEDAGYKVAPLNLATAAAVPDDADVLVVAGPRADLLEPEAERLRRYLERGGHLLVLADVDVPQAPLPRLAGILKGYGIELRDAVLIEPNLRLALPDPLVAIVEQFATHPATSGLAKGGLAALLPIARPVLPADKAPEGVEQLTWLARSSATSWATPVSAFTPGARLGFDAKRDLKGPVTVAAAATFRPAKGAGAPAPAAAASPAAAPSPQAAASPSPSPQPAAAERKGRLVVIGDADFASNQWFGHPANRELVVGALAWLAAEEAILSIQRPEAVSAPLFLTPAQSAAALLVAFLLPLGAAGAGVAVWLVRRRR